ncbi:hypothetical protein FO519_004542 [Halicephalobus sp. NKZ332]|nr:hypothetical protein FO519_004542 [Halicephalobus sp. NKZ332]
MTNISVLFILLGLLLTSITGKKQFRRSYIGYEIDNEIDYDVEEYTGSTNEDEERLVVDIFRDYNNLIRPSPCYNSTVVYIEFGMAMILLINVDEINQIMQTNVWLTFKWNDCQFHWNPADYGGIQSMRIPQDRVWVPDIVLFNNADGQYEVSYHSNVVVDYQGNITWVPPAIYKSSCRIDVEFFPFDQQTCTLLFGSWTYDSEEVKLKWYMNKRWVELEDYSYSGTWDIIDVPGQLIDKQSKIEFHIVIRRKTLFYTVILIIPTVLMAFLSIMVFYLPAECCEKVTLGISILLALVVFLLLVSKILPPSSDSIPLMAKFLLLIFVLNVVTIMSTVIIINIYFRSASTHRMPRCIRTIFLQFLPTLLMMKRPERIPIFNGYFVEEYCAEEIFDASLIMPSIAATILPFSDVARLPRSIPKFDSPNDSPKNKKGRLHQLRNKWSIVGKSKSVDQDRIEMSRALDPPLRVPPSSSRNPLFSGKYSFAPEQKQGSSSNHQETAQQSYETRVSKELRATVDSIAFIAEHLKSQMSSKKIQDDWKYIAMVIDRLLLVFFFGVTLGGTVGIIFSAPHVFDFVDQDRIIKRLIAQSKLDQQTFIIRASEDEEKLIIDLFKGYNQLVRPSANNTNAPVQINFSLALVLLINVDEKNQIMQTNVWPTMRWMDHQLQWNPKDYGGIKTIRIPPDKVWLPDIVLFNNADGQYEVSFYSNVVVEHTGEMLWVPPAIYKSSCTIDVEFFPFDEQVCNLVFGSWTYGPDEVTIRYLMGKRQVELNDYSLSGVWDVMEVPGELIQKKSKIAYQIKIRRKSLFYTTILIIPTVMMAFLSMMVFYLPAEASEKITLAISILLALVVFLLLVSKILPPTSSTIPLIAKYLIMTFILNIITIVVTVIIINIYFRGPTTHRMPIWVRALFLKYLPLLFLMQRPITDEYRRKKLEDRRKSEAVEAGAVKSRKQKYIPGEYIEMNKAQVHHHPYCSLNRQRRYNSLSKSKDSETSLLEKPNNGSLIAHSPTLENESFSLGRQERFPSYRKYSEDLNGILSEEAIKAMDAIEYITEHLRKDNQYKRIREEWKYVSMVIDRLLLYVFFAVTVGGTCGIFLSAPNVFEYVDQNAVIEKLKKSAEAEIII